MPQRFGLVLDLGDALLHHVADGDDAREPAFVHHREVADAAAQSGNVSDLHRLWRGTCWSGDMLVGYGEGASAEEALGIAVTHGLEVVQGGPRQEEAEAKEEEERKRR